MDTRPGYRICALLTLLASVGFCSAPSAQTESAQTMPDASKLEPPVTESFSARQFDDRVPPALREEDEDAFEKVIVGAEFLNLYTGPGRGYVISHVIEYGEPLWLLKRRTDWVKAMTRGGKTGWAKIADLDAIFAEDGVQVRVPTPGVDGYGEQGFRFGVAYGDFEGANALGVSLGYRFTRNLSAEVRAAQTIGAYSDSQTYQVAVVHQPFPEWRFSPYFLLGSGVNITSPNATIVATEDRQDTTMLTGVGVTTFLSRRFALRAEVANHYLLTSRENNQEIVEWKLGFDVFM